MKNEEKASGINPVMSEVEMALEDIMGIEDAADDQQQSQTATKKIKADEEKMNGEKIRRKAMEKLGQTQKQKAADGELDNGKKKRRRSTTAQDSLSYLKVKNEHASMYKEEEIELRKKELELESKKHDAMMQVVSQQQQQQQKQLEDFQHMMLTMMSKLTQK